MKVIVSVLLALFLFSGIHSCKKSNNPESYIESVDKTNGKEVFLNIFYSYSRFDNVTYGVCWSDTDTLPVRSELHAITQVPNFTEKKASSKYGSKQLRLDNVIGGTKLKARSYIKIGNGSLIYSKDVFEFETDIFHDMGCEINMNELQAEEIGTEPIMHTYSEYTSDGNLLITATTSSLILRVVLKEAPTSRDGYEIVTGLPNELYGNTVGLQVTNKITGCFERHYDEDSLFFNNINNEVLYVKFCAVDLYPYTCNYTEKEMSGFFKVNL